MKPQPDTVVIIIKTTNTDGSTTELTTEPLDARDVAANQPESRFRMRADLDAAPFDDFEHYTKGRWSRHSIFAPDYEAFELDVRLRPKAGNKNPWVYRVVHKEKPTNRLVMEQRYWGDFTISKYTEEEAAQLVEQHGLAAHFFFVELP